jgi:serine/threonine protein kinase/Tfp pilus assembly protein PilF
MISHTISHYKIIEKLGEGGMGEVYLAEDHKLERKVAIKFLPQHLTKDKENVERFEREAKAAASLNHPNIVTIYEIAEENDQIFIVMEYVEGKSLRDVINESSKFPIPNSSEIITQISEGLSQAHKAGIVHRDIKPENIIIGKDARVKILDFGLAKLKGVSKLTKETSTMGTAHYMSPEQIQGKDVDQRSDIWSVGVLLYELLTGETPFKGDYEQAVSYAIINEKLNISKDKDKPQELINIIERCLAKNPADRYQKADEIIDDLSILKNESSVKQTRKIHPDKKRYLKVAIPVFVAIIAVIILLFVDKEAESTSRIPIAVVDFKNDTGDSTLNGLSGMLTTALEQSRRLKVITRSRMFDILKQLNKENVDIIDVQLGKEIANHAGIKVLILPSVQKFGQLYNIDIKVIDPLEDEFLHTDRESGESLESIPEMIDLLAEKTREILEESEEEIQQSSTPVAEITTPNLEAYQHYFKGQEYVDKMTFVEAEKEFERAIELDSTFGLAYYGLAYAMNYWEWETDLERAKEQIYKAYKYIDKIPEKEKHFVHFVKTLTDSGWGNASLKILREMEKIYPDDKEVIYNIGDICYHMGDYQESLKYLTRVLDMDNKSARTLEHLFRLYRKTGDYKQMMNFAKKYVRNVGDYQSYRFLAEGYIKLNDTDSGIIELEKHLKLYPQKKFNIYPGLGLLYLEKGELGKVSNLLNNCLEACDEASFVGLVRILSYRLDRPISTYLKFEQILRSALIKYPDNIFLQRQLGYNLDIQDRISEAEKVFIKLDKIKPNNYRVLWWLGFIRIKLGKYELAEDNLKESLKYTPQHMPTWKEDTLYWLSLVSMRLNNYKQAEYYAKLKKQKGKSKIMLAEIYFTQDKYRLAVDQAKEALLFDSTYHAWAHEELGYLYAMQDQFDEAELHAKKSYELSSDYYNYNLIAWILIVSDKDIDRGIQMALDSLETRSDNILNVIKYNYSVYNQVPVYTIGEYVLGIGYQKKGDYSNAVNYFEKAHQLLPHREDIKSDLEKARKQLAER